MGLSSGGSSSSNGTSINGSAQAWAQPIASGAADMGTGIFNQTQPLTNGLTNNLSSMIPGMSQDFANNSAMMTGNANYLNGMVGGLGQAAGSTYNNMTGVGNAVNGAMNTALGNYNSPNAAGAALPLALRQLYSGGSDPSLRAAQGYTQSILGGALLNGNPYLQNVIDSTNRDVTDGVNSQFEASGRYGSGAYAGTLAKQLANNEGNLRYQDYTNQIGNMNTAAGLAGQLSGQQSSNNSANYGNLVNSANANSNIANTSYGQAMQAAGLQPSLAQASYAGVNPLLSTVSGASDAANASMANLPQILNAYTTTATLPYSGFSAYTNGLGSLFNGGTSQNNSSSWNASISDRRVKTDIRRESTLRDGLGVYSWRYKIGGPRVTGVMADEVARLRPWALGPKVGPYHSVDYSKLEAA